MRPNGWLWRSARTVRDEDRLYDTGVADSADIVHRTAVCVSDGSTDFATNWIRKFEEAAISLGATRVQTFVRVIAPPSAGVLHRIALAFARAVGEYGSVIFIAGNMPMKSEIGAGC